MKLRNAILFPLSLMYRLGGRIHRYVVSSRAEHFSIPVLSVGGISAGGSGKTPFVRALIDLLQEKYYLIILTRGYGRVEKGEVVLNGGEEGSPDMIGDEPSLLARSLINGLIGVGSNRAALLRKILEEHSLPDNSLVILDDGFQHYQLARDIDIVLIDEQTPNERFLLPAGYLRESPSSLSRAGILVVTNEKGEQMAERHARPETLILRSHSEVSSPIHWQSGKKWEGEKGPVILVTGIARPERVRTGLQSEGFMIAAHRKFRDHHRYTQTDIRSIQHWIRSHHAIALITTEKDAVKLERFPELAQLLYVLPLKTVIREEEQLLAFIQNTIQSRAEPS